MKQVSYGCGEYKYFAYPLPESLSEMRATLYSGLAPIANQLMETLRLKIRYPFTHEEFLQLCHQNNQHKPTPLMLKYETGDYNRLHQDQYGDEFFPLQAVLLLSCPDKEFSGGEFILYENEARKQSKAKAFNLTRGDLLFFWGKHRAINGVRGPKRVNMRHGLSEITSGKRYALGIIFHDAA